MQFAYMPINVTPFFHSFLLLLLSASAAQDDNSFSYSVVKTCSILCLCLCFLPSQGEKTTIMDIDVPQFTQYCVMFGQMALNQYSDILIFHQGESPSTATLNSATSRRRAWSSGATPGSQKSLHRFSKLSGKGKKAQAGETEKSVRKRRQLKKGDRSFTKCIKKRRNARRKLSTQQKKPIDCMRGLMYKYYECS